MRIVTRTFTEDRYYARVGEKIFLTSYDNIESAMNGVDWMITGFSETVVVYRCVRGFLIPQKWREWHDDCLESRYFFNPVVFDNNSGYYTDWFENYRRDLKVISVTTVNW